MTLFVPVAQFADEFSVGFDDEDGNRVDLRPQQLASGAIVEIQLDTNGLTVGWYRLVSLSSRGRLGERYCVGAPFCTWTAQTTNYGFGYLLGAEVEEVCLTDVPIAAFEAVDVGT